MRTEEELELYHVFGGVKEVGKMESLVDEIHGCTDNPATILKRIPGKLLCCTGSLGGPVWTLTGLRFRDRAGIFRQAGGIITISPNANPIPGGFVFPDFKPPDEEIIPDPGKGNLKLPPGPDGWKPEDWPRNYKPPLIFDPPPKPKGPQDKTGGNPPDMQLFASPDIVFNRPSDQSKITRKNTEVWTNDLGLSGNLYNRVRVNFSGSWMIVVTDDHNITPSGTRLYDGDTFAGKMWTGIHMPLEIGFDFDGPGQQIGVITFTVVDQWGNAVKNQSGSKITATVLVTVKNYIPAIQLTGAIDFTFVVGDPSVPAKTVNLKNVGTVLSTLSWGSSFSITGWPVGKLSAVPSTGTLSTTANQNIVIGLDTTGAAVGSKTGTFEVQETVISGVIPKSLPVSITVIPVVTVGPAQIDYGVRPPWGWVTLTLTSPDNWITPVWSDGVWWHYIQCAFSRASGGTNFSGYFDMWDRSWSWPYPLVYAGRFPCDICTVTIDPTTGVASGVLAVTGGAPTQRGTLSF